jgi:hypothetical protein
MDTHSPASEFDRRVLRREFRSALGFGDTWFRCLERNGVIPQGRVDPGGRRKWWPASVVRETIDRLTAEATTVVATPTPPKRKSRA